MKRARLGLLAAATIVLPVIAGACGDDGSSGGTLPPIITTTTSTTVNVTVPTERTYYVIQPGDTLSKIATRFSVSAAEVMALNGIVDPNHVEAGQRIEIPPTQVVLDTLPDSQPATSAP